MNGGGGGGGRGCTHIFILTITSEYGSSVWDPHYEALIDDLEKTQKPAASFVNRNYTYEKGSMTDILKPEDQWSCKRSPETPRYMLINLFDLNGNVHVYNPRAGSEQPLESISF